MNDTDTLTRPVTVNPVKHERKRHIVKLDENGQPEDKCLCGYLWDVYPIPHASKICQECVEELRKRGQG